ncbi:hypothetical protein RJ640_028364 [Escallonia rubra]|uniref:Uncharacterized protein n=1 Tax=Escallonia rubra TaxID=112253 RepID=A0AA88R4Y2_9ASTE|nr:hypothetical protein RJ640_028364 [Escallonia rubra]
MERRVIVVCTVVGFLGLLSAALGFAAEAKRIKGSQVQFPSPSECVYPRSPAMVLGLTAAMALMIAQITVNVATGFTFVIAFLLLLTGAALNDQHGEENMYFGNYYCYVVKRGVFAGAAVLSVASVALGIVYYVTLTSTKDINILLAPSAPNHSGIAMGQPQFPPQNSQDPVFVHEDTYMRRQFT